MGIAALELRVLCQQVRPVKGKLGRGRGSDPAGARSKHSTRTLAGSQRAANRTGYL